MTLLLSDMLYSLIYHDVQYVPIQQNNLLHIWTVIWANGHLVPQDGFTNINQKDTWPQHRP